LALSVPLSRFTPRVGGGSAFFVRHYHAPVHDEVLRVLKDCVEGRMSHSDWRDWWSSHAAEVEAQCDRFTFLRLKCRGLGEAESILEAHDVSAQPRASYCRRCGEPLFTALPGKTTVEEIRAFAESSKFQGREHILRDGWIHPGQYCPNGCTQILWNIKRDDNDA
jgi:hypothetical protein